ncbi:hypothetical protein PMAG_a0031 [Pseudoalteromonas mariniglutinosa NCIMB 1770]|nr:hypothetical protein [Pseudoalteromonas mariniglutinosa NCIMB 1770]
MCLTKQYYCHIYNLMFFINFVFFLYQLITETFIAGASWALKGCSCAK